MTTQTNSLDFAQEAQQAVELSAEATAKKNTEFKDALQKSMERSTEPATPAKTEKKEETKALRTMAGLKQGQIADLLMGMRDRLVQVLDKTMTPERVVQMASMTIFKNPALADCSTASLMGAVMQAAILGFPPVDSLGYCYFVPYANPKAGVKEVQFQIGYKGLIDLARRSGKLLDIYAEAVYEGDEFDVEYGLERSLKHKPKFLHKGKTDKIEFVYAVATLADGAKNFVILNRVDIERLRQRSPGQKAQPSGAWMSDYEAMAKAKALKQLSKFLPLNIDDAVRLTKDDTTHRVDNTGQTLEEFTDYEEVV